MYMRAFATLAWAALASALTWVPNTARPALHKRWIATPVAVEIDDMMGERECFKDDECELERWMYGGDGSRPSAAETAPPTEEEQARLARLREDGRTAVRAREERRTALRRAAPPRMLTVRTPLEAGLALTQPTQAEAEAMGVRDWPPTIITQGGRGAFDADVEDGSLRYVLEGSGTVQRDTTGEPLAVSPNTLVRVVGEGGALRWQLDEGMRASRSITQACAVLSTAAASVQPLALSPLAPAAPAARAMATAAVQTDAHKKKRSSKSRAAAPLTAEEPAKQPGAPSSTTEQKKRGRRASASTAAAASPKRSKATDVRLEPPANWRATWELIVELRADRTAVVDSMGTEAIAGESTKEERDFDALVSLMLSSQTKDTDTPDERLDELIYACGFHNNKATTPALEASTRPVKYLKATSRILLEQHGGRVPDTMDGLLALPGVGPKMALILLRVAFGKVEGISVDTHVHRICNQLGWAGPGGTKTPEQTRRAIEAWMPADIWAEVNLVLVGLGQEVQTEKSKLLRKCLACSDPAAALRLASVCGVKVEPEAKKAGLVLPPGLAL
ncbi:putative endonuclease III [Emiliania huxleyi CCMP1516]|uniref:HhH-GPD domain-containing protein n=2 Tax=Emiliania huxleyi TaxID=2903 RepID=A0A0D3IBE1_EMIH1|nr:putative endonuclease III [Emiliania huxleyi CCMP1516]EOD08576.1 putative endonuclease III [Emiliania huxleyi CCMP1516]|eukprot:XP_005761005.1 putative endonuclease III [Emiliania huxleyi CCMP1516]